MQQGSEGAQFSAFSGRVVALFIIKCDQMCKEFYFKENQLTTLSFHNSIGKTGRSSF